MLNFVYGLLSMSWGTFLIFGIVFYLTWEYNKRRNLPPGPFSLPLIGSIGLLVHLKDMKGLPPHVGLEKIARKYGNVFSVWMGPSLMVVLNGYEAIHTAYVKQGQEFTDRANWINAVKHGLKQGKGVSFSNGEEWYTLRKFCLQSMRDFGLKAGEVEGKIHEEINIMVQYVKNKKGELMDISHLLQMAASNVIGSIVFGERFDYEDSNLHNLLETLDLVVKGAGFTSPLNFLPKFMHPLFREEYALHTKRDNRTNRVRSLVAGIYERHATTFDPENIRDFMDLYIQSTKEDVGKLTNKYFHKGNMWKVIYDLFLAGSETTSSSLEWAFMIMVEKPEIQERCQQVIWDQVGDRPVQISDRQNLKYIDAVLNEVLRMSCVIPLGVPRTNVDKDISFMGYTIPKKSIIVPNIYAAHFDPKYWPEPFVFKPERFLDTNGKLIKPDSFLPFSLGPRNCLGDNLSRMEMFLMFTNLLQKFNFIREEQAPPHDFEPNDEQYMTLRPKSYRLKAEQRT